LRETRATQLATWTRPSRPAAPFGLTVSNPPTQADGQALPDKLDELINTLNA
jgi:hypothetical protein